MLAVECNHVSSCLWHHLYHPSDDTLGKHMVVIVWRLGISELV